MPEKKTCINCNEEIKYPNFACSAQPGNHQLPTKIYYHFGGRDIADPIDRKKFSPAIVLDSGARRDAATGKSYETDPLEIKFQQMGKFETMDARVQYYLDLRGFRSDAEAEEVWKEIYIPLPDRMRLQKEQLEQQKREIKEQQSVLDNLKARTSAKVAVPA